jgi:hypothetical protein
MKFFVTTIALCAMAFANAQDCCKAEAKQAKQEACCSDKKMTKEEEFMAMAAEMAAKADSKDMCCRSTPAHPVAKGGEGCCNAKGEPAKFKVFVAGVGYTYYGCEDSAKQGRSQWVAKGRKAGNVQKVASKISIQ